MKNPTKIHTLCSIWVLASSNSNKSFRTVYYWQLLELFRRWGFSLQCVCPRSIIWWPWELLAKHFNVSATTRQFGFSTTFTLPSIKDCTKMLKLLFRVYKTSHKTACFCNDNPRCRLSNSRGVIGVQLCNVKLDVIFCHFDTFFPLVVVFH